MPRWPTSFYCIIYQHRCPFRSIKQSFILPTNHCTLLQPDDTFKIEGGSFSLRLLQVLPLDHLLSNWSFFLCLGDNVNCQCTNLLGTVHKSASLIAIYGSEPKYFIHFPLCQWQSSSWFQYTFFVNICFSQNSCHSTLYSCIKRTHQLDVKLMWKVCDATGWGTSFTTTSSMWSSSAPPPLSHAKLVIMYILWLICIVYLCLRRPMKVKIW